MAIETSNQRNGVARSSGTDPRLLWGLIALLVVGAGYLLYHNWQLTKQFDEDRSALRRTVEQRQLANDRQQLSFGMKTFVWAVRNALLQNKPGEVDEYFNTLVKDRGVKEVLLIDPGGKVTLSTNKKNQGIAFNSRFPIYLLGQREVYFGNKVPYELAAPVMGPNRRLGTLVMFYNPAPVLPDSATTVRTP